MVQARWFGQGTLVQYFAQRSDFPPAVFMAACKTRGSHSTCSLCTTVLRVGRPKSLAVECLFRLNQRAPLVSQFGQES